VPGVLFAIALLVVGALAYSGTSEEQRAQLIRALRKASARPRAVAARNRLECDPFLDVLRARTRFAVVTPILIALNVIVFVSMIFGRGSLADPETLVAWGANFGPRTTNGEWWRLVTAPFVHAGLLPLVVNLTALAQLGLILERIVGRRALAAVYVAAGVLAGLVSIAAHPVVVSAGASAAIASLYGLLLAHYGLSLLGVVFEAYFMYLQIAVIGAVCIWCTTYGLSLVLRFVIALAVWMRQPQSATSRSS